MTRKLQTERPHPPASLLSDEVFRTVIMPAPELRDWIQACILDTDGPIHNPAHLHLVEADIECLWASSAFGKQGRTVIGQCEEVAFRAGGWQKARQEQQFYEWFGRVPKFVVTLAADYCATCSDAEFCALVEHELMHIGQATDEFGSPKFTKDGLPKLMLRDHDVNEFVAIVERYGVGNPEGGVARMVEAAGRAPTVSVASIAHSCGTCL